jgi:hypothetical protein
MSVFDPGQKVQGSTSGNTVDAAKIKADMEAAANAKLTAEAMAAAKATIVSTDQLSKELGLSPKCAPSSTAASQTAPEPSSLDKVTKYLVGSFNTASHYLGELISPTPTPGIITKRSQETRDAINGAVPPPTPTPPPAPPKTSIPCAPGS